MNYNFSLKLEDITAVSIAIKLWQQSESDVRNEMSKLEPDALDWCSISWIEIRETIVNRIGCRLFKKISQFSIPLSLQDKIRTAILPVGNELIQFILETFDIFIKHSDICWMEYICWTQFGMIDERRTTEAFLTREFFSVRERYTLACKYICEDFVTVLWKKLPENINQVNEISCEEQLINFWRDEVLKWYRWHPVRFNDDRLIGHLIQFSMKKNNTAAFSYFWEKLESEKRENQKVTFAHWSLDAVNIIKFSMITIVLLNEMNSEQQMKFFEEHSFQIIRYFDFWLLRDFFLPTVKKAMGSITARDFGRLLEMIAQKTIENYWEAERYRRWFLGLWMQSSNDLKKHLITNPPDRLFEYLGRGENFKFITMILDETTVEERRVLLNTRALRSMCKYLIVDDKMKFVVKILTYSFPCHDEVRDFVRVMPQTTEVCLALIIGEKLELLENLLNYFDDVSAERIVELKRELVFGVGTEVCRALVIDNRSPLIEKFLIWGMLKDEEMAEFKKELIGRGSEGVAVCFRLLEKGKLEIADEIIRFCYSSDEEIGEYKKGMMLSSLGVRMFTMYVHKTGCFDSNCDALVKIIKWFNVEDKEIVKLFIVNFEEEIVYTFYKSHAYCQKLVEGLHRMVVGYALV